MNQAALALRPSEAPPQSATCNRPHLVHVFPSFNIGGVQVRFAALAQALGGRFRHTVLALNNEYGAAALVSADAAVAYASPPPPSRSPLTRLRRLAGLLDELNPDLVLTHNWGAMEMVVANAFAGRPHIHLEDGFGPEEANRQLLRRVWTRRLALARSQVIVPSKTLHHIATRTWGLDSGRVAHIPNGIAPLGKIRTPLNSLGLDLPAGDVRIAWAGALRPEKNPLRLLRAFAPLKDRAVLLLIGDGPERPAVLEEADRLGLGAKLVLLGDRTDSRDIIAQCDLLALPSDTEQMPLVVLEAMDAALPVVASDVGDIREMVAEDNRAFIVPASDAAFAGALQTLVGDAGLRSRVGLANLARQRAVYTLPPMVEAYSAVFARAAARTRQGRPA